MRPPRKLYEHGQPHPSGSDGPTPPTGTVPHLHLSGIATASGGTFSQVTMEGISTVHGDVRCDQCRISGMATIRGRLSAREMVVQGKLRVDGGIDGEWVQIHGHADVDGDCTAERFEVQGGFRFNGLLNADEIRIYLVRTARVREMGGSRIHVSGRQPFLRLGRRNMLRVETIEGDEVYLEFTSAAVVRGRSVHIGPGCTVSLVEYSDTLTRDDNAHVLESRRI